MSFPTRVGRLPTECLLGLSHCQPKLDKWMQVKSEPIMWSAGDGMQPQQSSASLASASGRREVSDEDIAAYAKQLSGPRFGTPRIFATSAKLGACCRHLPHSCPCVVMSFSELWTPGSESNANMLLCLHAGIGVRRLFQAIADDMAGLPPPPPTSPVARQTSPVRLGEFKFSDTYLNTPRTPPGVSPPGTPHARQKRPSCC